MQIYKIIASEPSRWEVSACKKSKYRLNGKALSQTNPPGLLVHISAVVVTLLLLGKSFFCFKLGWTTTRVATTIAALASFAVDLIVNARK